MNFEAFRNHNFQKFQNSKIFDFDPENTLRRPKIHQSGTRLKRRVKVRKKKRYFYFEKRGAPPGGARSAIFAPLELELELTLESDRELEPEL